MHHRKSAQQLPIGMEMAKEPTFEYNTPVEFLRTYSSYMILKPIAAATDGGAVRDDVIHSAPASFKRSVSPCILLRRGQLLREPFKAFMLVLPVNGVCPTHAEKCLSPPSTLYLIYLSPHQINYVRSYAPSTSGATDSGEVCP